MVVPVYGYGAQPYLGVRGKGMLVLPRLCFALAWLQSALAKIGSEAEPAKLK